MKNRMFLFFKRLLQKIKVFLPAPVRQAIKPLAVFVFQKFLIVLPVPKSLVAKPVNGVIFEFNPSENIHTRQMFLNFYEDDVRSAIKEILRPGDVFIDVGASIGYLSAFGAGLIGKTGEVHSFEPVSQNFEKLKRLAAMNRGYKIFANQCALGERKGEAVIYVTKDPMMNNSIVRDFVSPDRIATSIVVPMRRLDEYMKEKNLMAIKLIKIDVEGYEFSVLKGLEHFFRECKNPPSIICEICPPAAASLGYSMNDFFSYMERFSYKPFELLNFNAEFNKSLIGRQHSINVLFKTA